MAINKIVCACGAGMGSSLIVHLNTEEIVKELGHPEVVVDHTTVTSVDPESADLFVVAKDLAKFLENVADEKKVILESIVDKDELRNKLAQKFA